MAHTEHRELIGAWVKPSFKNKIRKVAADNQLTLSVTMERMLAVALKELKKDKTLLYNIRS